MFFCASWQPPAPITAVFSVSGVVLNTDLETFLQGFGVNMAASGFNAGKRKDLHI